MNNSSIVTTTFCRKCKKLRSCLETNVISDYRYLCKQCTKEEDLLVTCINCGREATTDILKHGGYCHLCERENISECDLCGAEVYNNNLIDGICSKCATGENRECIKCGNYFSENKLTSDNLCPKCSIKIHKKLIFSKNKQTRFSQIGLPKIYENQPNRSVPILGQKKPVPNCGLVSIIAI